MGETCKSCGAAVVFAQHASGKWSPFDAQPDPRGDWVIEDGRVRKADPLLDRVRYLPHWSTCPQAKQWRKEHRRG